jgi:ankyrin repeat protein
MRNYFKYFIYLYVFSWFSFVHAGVYEDFFRSIHANDKASVQYLVESRGVDPNWPNEKGEPALTLALFLGSEEVARYLATTPQLRTEITNLVGETPLMLAAITNQMDVARALIDRGAEVNRPGWTPLHYAATNGHIAMMRLMLEQSAYIDAEAPNGNTPLMMAAQYASPLAVKLLLEEGADPNLKNHAGQTARDLAALNKNPQAAYYIDVFLDAWRVQDARDRSELN